MEQRFNGIKNKCTAIFIKYLPPTRKLPFRSGGFVLHTLNDIFLFKEQFKSSRPYKTIKLFLPETEIIFVQLTRWSGGHTWNLLLVRQNYLCRCCKINKYKILSKNKRKHDRQVKKTIAKILVLKHVLKVLLTKFL